MIILAMITICSLLSASAQFCTTGLRRSLDQDFTHLVPLLGRTDTTGPEQWIFPGMQFTCSASITTWNFRGIPGQNVDEACRVHLTTWRRDPVNALTTQYKRTSTTEGNTANFIVNGPIFTYVLATPVQVEPGDIVGIEMGTLCRSFDNIQSVNASVNGRSFTSYRRNSDATTFNLDSSTTVLERNFIPLIQDTIGQLMYLSFFILIEVESQR